jgi:hypothetical protein
LEELTVVNLHESGLKATKFKALIDEIEKVDENVDEVGRWVWSGVDVGWVGGVSASLGGS